MGDRTPDLLSLLDPEIVLGRVWDAVADSWSWSSFLALLVTLLVARWTVEYATWDRAAGARARRAKVELRNKHRELQGTARAPHTTQK